MISSKFLALRNDHLAILDAQKIIKEYNCKFCGEGFRNGCALGGHVSKVHKIKNRTYAKKLVNVRSSQIDYQRAKFYRNLILEKEEDNQN